MTHKNDFRSADQIMADIHQAIVDGETGKYCQLYAELIASVKGDLSAEQRKMIEEQAAAVDQVILAKRGKNPLTSEEVQYFTKLGEAMASKDPKQAISNLDVTMPVTVMDTVMEQVRTKHPLLSKIDFAPIGAITRWIYNKSGRPEAAWGELCDEIVTELSLDFAMAETGLYKLSAFLPVCKQALKFGPQYLATLITETLYEAIANAMEKAVVNGTGKSQPIGMTRQVGDDVTVVGGVYPQKEKTVVTDLGLVTVGGLIDAVSKDDDGKDREIRDLILVCNQSDYYTKIVPAITILTPNGEYRNVLPYHIDVIPVAAGLQSGEAVFGLGYRYFAGAGSDTEGNIEYSDHARFLQDQRLYIVKAFANGFPKDNSAFLFLDVSGLKPATYKVELVSDEAAEDEDDNG